MGGGSDTDPYASRYGGLVLSMAINLRQHITLYCDEDLYEISTNIFPGNADPNFYYQILKEYGINDMHQTKISSTFDGVIESGLGSSASAAVALIAAISKRLKLGLNPLEIAEKAWTLEKDTLGLFGGKQDQYAASLGGVNIFEFGKKVKVTPLAKSFIEPLLPAMVLFHTGVIRKSPKIQEELKDLTDEQITSLTKLKADVVTAAALIIKKDTKGFGQLLDQSWQLKKESNSLMTNAKIDSFYNKGLQNGAWGGKLLGSGGGGYFLFIVDPKIRDKFIAGMGQPNIDFSPDWNGVETRELEI